jgi:hypothetical protein
MLSITLVAALFGWAYDHYRLSEQNARLNQEASTTLQFIFRGQSSGTIRTLNSTAPRVYNFSLEQDRKDYVRDVLSERGSIEFSL